MMKPCFLCGISEDKDDGDDGAAMACMDPAPAGRNDGCHGSCGCGGFFLAFGPSLCALALEVSSGATKMWLVPLALAAADSGSSAHAGFSALSASSSHSNSSAQ